MNRRNRLAVFLIVLALAAAARAGGDDSVVVEHHPVSATTRYYDRKNLPPEMPPPSPDEAGVTVSQFDCTALVRGTVISSHRQGRQPAVLVRVDSVKIVVHLDVTEWILNVAPAKILAHENGHRRISERYYDQGDAIARAIGHNLIGQKLSGNGDTEELAVGEALKSAAEQAARDYMAQVRDRSQIVQDRYDRITHHGTNSVDEDAAIAQAIAESAGK